MRILLLFFLFNVYWQLYSQVQDTNLTKLQDEQLMTIIDDVESDKMLAIRAAKVYLERGKVELDTIKMARGFDRLARLHDPRTNLKYVDSILNLTSYIKHITYPGIGYLLKAWNLKNLGDINGSLDNFIIAYYDALENNNVSTETFAMNYIVYFKTYWGDPEEALKLQMSMLDRVKSDEFLTQLGRTFRIYDEVEVKKYQEEIIVDSNLNIITCYIELGRIKDALEVIDIMIERAESNQFLETYMGLLEAKMELNYYSDKFKEAITIASDIISKRQELEFNKYPVRPNIYYFKGISQLKMGRELEGINSLAIADSLYASSDNMLYTKHRELYTILINWYKDSDSKHLYLKYLNRLIKRDSIYINKFSKVDPKIIDDFETPKLLAEKEELIAQLEWEKGKEQRKQWVIGLFLAMSIATTGYYFWRQRQYKLRFQAIMDKGLVLKPEQTEQPRRNGISAGIIEDILKHLEVFEREHQYTDQNVSLQNVAKGFGTNSSYLSKVINLKKDKNFSQYISELRITFAVNELQNNPRFRKYTIKAIAQEVGFGNAQSFSKAFYARTGLHPSYFIRNLNKQVD